MESPDVDRMDSQKTLSDKKKALMRMEELRAEFAFPTDFNPDRELEEARRAKYGRGHGAVRTV